MQPETLSRAVRNSYAILSILVLFFHAGASNSEFLFNKILGSTYHDLLRLPLFFFIGGLVLERQSHRRTELDLLKRYFTRLIFPFIWFAPLYYLIETSFSNTDYRRPQSLMFSIIYPGYHLWFLPAFFLASFVGILQIRYLKSLYLNIVFVLLTAIISVGVTGEVDGFFASYASIKLLPFLALGILFSRLLFQHEGKIEKKFYFLSMTFLFILFLFEYPNTSFVLTILSLPVAFIASGFLKTAIWSRTLSNHTIQIYLFSPLGIGLSRHLLYMHDGLSVTQEVFISALCGLVTTFVIIWFSRKTKFTSFLVGV